MINTRINFPQKLVHVFILFLSLTSIITYAKIQTDNEAQLDLTLPTIETKKRKSRMRKSSKKSTKQNGKKEEKTYRTYKDMTYDQLEQSKNKFVLHGNYESAVKYLEQMIKLCNDVEKIGKHLLEIADLLFEMGNYHKAALMYAEFVALYPGSQKVEYALYRATASSFNCTLSIDRDQTKTEETIELAKTFLSKATFKHYKTDIEAILSACYQKLIESELYVCSFYLKRNQFKAVEKRLNNIRSDLLDYAQTLEPHILTYEADLANKKGDSKTAQEKRTELAQKFPQVSQQLAQEKTRKSMLDWF